MRNLIKKILKEEYSPAGEVHKPSKFVYHKSAPSVRDNILKTGLLVSVGDCYKTYSQNFTEEECTPAIFATDSENEKKWFYSTWDDDVWRINTEIAGVRWYKDNHFEDYEEGRPIFSNNKHIVTFEDIKPESLKLIYKGTGKNI